MSELGYEISVELVEKVFNDFCTFESLQIISSWGNWWWALLTHRCTLVSGKTGAETLEVSTRIALQKGRYNIEFILRHGSLQIEIRKCTFTTEAEKLMTRPPRICRSQR